MSTPKISIITPVYNAQKTIKKCLDSIFSQTFKDFEVILVNDGSTDKTMTVIEKYLQNCHCEDHDSASLSGDEAISKIREIASLNCLKAVSLAMTSFSSVPSHQGKGKHISIISQENRGASAARNRGAKEARGEFLIFWDADVIGKPQLLEKMYQTLKNNLPAAYVYSSFKYGFKIFKLWPFTVEKLKRIPYIHTTSLIKRLYFTGFDENLKRFQDWDLWLTIAENSGKGIWIPEVLFKILAGGKMSYWLPDWAYKFKWLKKVKEYNKAMKIIKEKHGLR